MVITHHQTAGRGQRGNTWQSGKGLNLTMSLVLHPVFLTAVQQFQLNKVIALAVRETVQSYTEEPVKVKWPNDILIGNKKVCGILIENQLTGDKLSRSVVGIGLNVNQAEFESPMASSVSIYSGKQIDLAELFETLMQRIERRYLKFRVSSFEFDIEYIQFLYGVNEIRRFVIGDLQVNGIIRGVDENGRLIVEIDGSDRTFDLKEIRFVI